MEVTQAEDTVLLSDALSQLEARDRETETIPIKLVDFKVRGDGRYTVDRLDLYVPNLDTHPVKQLCATVGMPHSFYTANPSALNSNIFETRFKGLDADSAPANRQLRYRRTADGNRLLAILPHNFVPAPYSTIVKGAADALREHGDAVVRLSNIARVDDDHNLHLRVSFPSLGVEVAEGDPIELGLLVNLSEDGYSARARISLMLYQLICANGAIATYGQQHLLDFDYRGVAKFVTDALVREALARAGSDLSEVAQHCLKAASIRWTKDEAVAWLTKLEERRDVARTFLRKVRRELLAKEPETFTKWEVISEITEHAQRLPIRSRLLHEETAGRLLGLDLPRDLSVN